MLPDDCRKFMDVIKAHPTILYARDRTGVVSKQVRGIPKTWEHAVEDGSVKCNRCFTWFWKGNHPLCNR